MSMSTSDDGEVDEGVHFDLGVQPDVHVREEVPELDCNAPPPITTDGACATQEHPEYGHVYWCVEIGVDGQCPSETDPVVEQAFSTCSPGWCLAGREWCGPDPARADACCFWTNTTRCPLPGRPFTVHGRDRLAPTLARADWCDAIAIDASTLPATVRRALARAWTEDARCEHAAVASFARFTLQLLALGAPADLVARAQQAGIDELGHARAFFGLASAYAGAPVGPAALATSDALADGMDLEHIVAATVREGCIAETISLVQLATAHANVRDPALREMLAAIVDEELAHVELAWAFVDWALAHGDARLHAAVTAAFAAADAAIPRAPATDPACVDASTWRAHGRLHADERASLARATLRDIVRPCGERLLARGPTAPTGPGADTDPVAGSVVSAIPAMR
jgi:hypothetical protein